MWRPLTCGKYVCVHLLGLLESWHTHSQSFDVSVYSMCTPHTHISSPGLTSVKPAVFVAHSMCRVRRTVSSSESGWNDVVSKPRARARPSADLCLSVLLFSPKKAKVERDQGEGGMTGHRTPGVCLCCGLANNPLLSGQGRGGNRKWWINLCINVTPWFSYRKQVLERQCHVQGLNMSVSYISPPLFLKPSPVEQRLSWRDLCGCMGCVCKC